MLSDMRWWNYLPHPPPDMENYLRLFYHDFHLRSLHPLLLTLPGKMIREADECGAPAVGKSHETGFCNMDRLGCSVAESMLPRVKLAQRT